MKDRLDYISFHKFGHTVAHILAGIPFQYVTIKERNEKDEFDQISLGHIMFDKPKDDAYWSQFSFLNPMEFNEYFRDDFTKIAGLVAEGIYRRKPNYKAAKADFQQWVDSSLNSLPERLESKYIDFLLEYTIQVLSDNKNWSNITAVDLALIDEETLSHEMVREVIDKDRIIPEISKISDQLTFTNLLTRAKGIFYYNPIIFPPKTIAV